MLLIGLSLFGGFVRHHYQAAQGNTPLRVGIIVAALLLLFPAGRGFQVLALTQTYGSMLAYSVLVYSLDQKLETHYGHESAGQALHFRVKVEMVDELPENVVKCGWLLGVEFPKKGPIKDVAMSWSRPQLEQHGTVICKETCVKTAPDGIATLIFEVGALISVLPEDCPLRMRVRKSAIGSVMLMWCSSGTSCYQLASPRPGISPRMVASRSLVRPRPNLR